MIESSTNISDCRLTLRLVQSAALQILISLLKHLSTAFSNAAGTPQIYSVLIRKIVGSLLCPRGGSALGGKVEADIRDTYVETWLSSYDDLRWFFFRDAT